MQYNTNGTCLAKQEDLIRDKAMRQANIIHKRVNAKVKVQVLHHLENIGNNQKKQDIIISDNTAHTKVFVSEDNIRKMSVGKSYKFTGIWVKGFRAQEYLTTAKTEYEITTFRDARAMISQMNNRNIMMINQVSKLWELKGLTTITDV